MTGPAKHIGIVGGSVEGAMLCARIIQTEAEKRFEPDRRPQVTMHMHPFALYWEAISGGDRATLAAMLVDSVGRLARAGAEFAIIPANAPHIVIDEVVRAAPIPVLSILEETVRESRRRGLKYVGVLGVKWTMESGLYEGPLKANGIGALVPGEEDRRAIHGIIFDELLACRVVESSTARLLGIVEKLRASGCDGVALACTELPLALNEANCRMPALDTTRILAEAAVECAQSGGSTAPVTSPRTSSQRSEHRPSAAR